MFHEPLRPICSFFDAFQVAPTFHLGSEIDEKGTVLLEAESLDLGHAEVQGRIPKLG